MSTNDKAAWLAENLLGWHAHQHVNAAEVDLCVCGKSLLDRIHCNSLELMAGNGMLEIIEAMKERGWRMHLCITLSGKYLAEAFRGEAIGPHRFEFTAESLPAAVIEAVYEALQNKSLEVRPPFQAIAGANHLNLAPQLLALWEAAKNILEPGMEVCACRCNRCKRQTEQGRMALAALEARAEEIYRE